MNSHTWHLLHGDRHGAGRPAEGRCRQPGAWERPKAEHAPAGRFAAERVGGQAREGKGEEGGREGEGEARPRGGGALSRGLPGSLAAAVVMSAMLAMAQGADRAGERLI